MMSLIQADNIMSVTMDHGVTEKGELQRQIAITWLTCQSDIGVYTC